MRNKLPAMSAAALPGFAALVLALFAGGAALRARFPGDAAEKSRGAEALSRRLVRWNLALLEPPVAFWVVWGLRLEGEQIALPLLGFFVVGAGFLLGGLFLPLAGIDRESPRRPVFRISASLANHGFSMGGFLCFLFFGEEGVALTMLFVLYFLPWVFLFIFPYAQSRAPLHAGAPAAVKDRRRLQSVLRRLLSWNYTPLYAALIAVALNGAGAERPDFAFPLALLMLLSAGLYYLALGLSFDLRDFRAGLRPQLALACIKFALLPACVAGGLFALEASGLYALPSLWRNIVVLQACMPAAVYSVATAVLHRLDAGFAASLFLGSTGLFLLVGFPMLYLLFG